MIEHIYHNVSVRGSESSLSRNTHNFDNMIERIRTARAQKRPDTLRSCVQSFEARINKCIEVGGHNFKHLL